MATTLVNRTWRSSTPETVEQDLAALWRDIGREARVARAVMSNLVVFGGRPSSSLPREHMMAPDAVDAIVARHPSRVVVIEHEQDPHTFCAPAAASVGVVVFGPASARYAVEQILVRSTCAEASLPSIVRRLIRGDLPTSVWWTDDLSRTPPLRALVTMGRQLLYDSRAWNDLRRGVLALAPYVAHQPVNLADLNWRRLTPLRIALIHAAESSPMAIPPARLRIAHRPGDTALAWLLAGWLAARLDWTGHDWPRIEEARRGEEILSITIDTPPAVTSATLRRDRAIVTLPNSQPIGVAVIEEDEADALARELQSFSPDACLHDALGALARVFSSLA